MDNVPDLEQKIHSGIRFKDDRYMFIVDKTNFYKIDIKTNETKTYEGILTFSLLQFINMLIYRIKLRWFVFL